MNRRLLNRLLRRRKLRYVRMWRDFVAIRFLFLFASTEAEYGADTMKRARANLRTSLRW